MADIFIRSTNGNDSNNGSSWALAKKTLAGAQAIATANDRYILDGNEASYPITSGLTLSGYELAAYDETPATITRTGNYILTVPNQIQFRRINLSASVGTAVWIDLTSTQASIMMIDSSINRGLNDGTGTASRFTFIRTIIDMSLNTASFFPAGTTGAVSFHNCFILGNGTYQLMGSTAQPMTASRLVIKNCVLKDWLAIGTVGANNNGIQIDYNYFFNFDRILTYAGASNLAAGIGFVRNVFDYNTNFIQNTSTGILTLSKFNSLYNCITTESPLQNGLNSLDDLTIHSINDLGFWNYGGGDYRLEYDSVLASYYGDIIGANMLEHPSTYFSSIPTNKVENLYSYKDGSRTNNKTGTLSAGTLLSVGNVKIGVDRGDGQLGTYDGSDRHTDPGVSNVRSGTAYKSNSTSNNRTGTAAIPSAANTKIGVAVDATTGTYDGSDRHSDPGESNVKSGVAYKSNSTTNNKIGNRTDASPSNVKTGTGTYGANGTELTPAYSPDFPAQSNVAPDDTVDGQPGTMDLPSLSKVAPSDTLRGQAGTMDLPSLSNILPEDTLEGNQGTADVNALAHLPDEEDVLAGTPNFGKNQDKVPSLIIPETDDVNANELKIGVTKTIKGSDVTGTYDAQERYTDVPTDKVSSGYNYKYNSTTNNRLGIANLDQPSIDPGEDNVIKGTPYQIDGVNKVGKYDTGDDGYSTAINKRQKVLEELDRTLLSISPDTHSKYQETVKMVSTRPANTEGLVEDDYPHIQVIADETTYDNKFVMGGNILLATMRVRLVITGKSSWNSSDCEVMYEDIREAIVSGGYNLNRAANTVKLAGLRLLNADSKKEDTRYQAETMLVITYFEEIQQS